MQTSTSNTFVSKPRHIGGAGGGEPGILFPPQVPEAEGGHSIRKTLGLMGPRPGWQTLT